MSDECLCSRPWEGIPTSELQLRHTNRQLDLDYYAEQIKAERGSDPGLLQELERDYELAVQELDELEHELWHRRDPLSRSTIG